MRSPALVASFAVLLSCGRMGGAGSVGPDSNVEACTATRELLKNGDFESETLDAFKPLSGTGRVVDGVHRKGSCDGHGPEGPRSGRRVFSAASQDGAVNNEREIVVTQAIRLADHGLHPGMPVAASAFIAGGCGADDGSIAQIIVEFMRGGPEGEYLGQIATDAVDPPGIDWYQAKTGAMRIPDGTDTIVLAYRSVAPLGKASVELWTDDLSLAACGEGPELVAWTPTEKKQAKAPPDEPSRDPGPGAPLPPLERNRTLWTGRHTGCIIATSGELKCWGGTPKLPTDLRFVESSGRCLLDTEGAVWCSKEHGWAQETLLKNATQIAASSGALQCAAKAAGGIQCMLWINNGPQHAVIAREGEFIDIVDEWALRSDGAVLSFGTGLIRGTAWLDGKFASIAPPCALGNDGIAQCVGGGSKQALQALGPVRFRRLYRAPRGTVCGQLSTGEYRCWGGLSELQIPRVDFSQIDFTATHACGLVSGEPRVVCWGYAAAAGAHPPPELGGYLSEPPYPIGAKGFGTSKGAVFAKESRLLPEASCKKRDIAELPATLRAKTLSIAEALAKFPGRDRMLDIDLELPDPQNPKVLECEGWYELTSSAVASSGAEARIDMRVRFSDGDVLARQFEQRSSQMPPFTRETLQEFGGKRSETAGNVADVLDNAGNPIRGPAGTTQRSLALLWYRRGAQSGVDPNRVSWSGATFLVSSRMLVDVEIPGQHPLAAVKLRSWVDHAFGPLGR